MRVQERGPAHLRPPSPLLAERSGAERSSGGCGAGNLESRFTDWLSEAGREGLALRLAGSNTGISAQCPLVAASLGQFP